MKRLACIVLVALSMPGTAADSANAVGRLFFSAEQRAQLDALRAKKVAASQTKEEPLPEVVTYSGIVRRTDGKTAVWVNNKVLSEQELREQQTLAGRIQRDGQVLLQPQATGTVSGSVRLKVGQRAELVSGRVDENYNMLIHPVSITPEAPASKSASKADAKQEEEKPAVKSPVPVGGNNANDLAAKFAPIDPNVAAKLRALVESKK